MHAFLFTDHVHNVKRSGKKGASKYGYTSPGQMAKNATSKQTYEGMALDLMLLKKMN